MSEALTAQKLEVVRRFWEAFAREPIALERLRAGQLDWLMEEFYAPDVVFDLSAVVGWPEARTYEGYDGVRRFYEAWFATFEQVSFELGPSRPSAAAASQVGRRSSGETPTSAPCGDRRSLARSSSRTQTRPFETRNAAQRPDNPRYRNARRRAI